MLQIAKEVCVNQPFYRVYKTGARKETYCFFCLVTACVQYHQDKNIKKEEKMMSISHKSLHRKQLSSLPAVGICQEFVKMSIKMI